MKMLRFFLKDYIDVKHAFMLLGRAKQDENENVTIFPERLHSLAEYAQGATKGIQIITYTRHSWPLSSEG